jgi:molybdate transport system regulatory protein
MPGEIMSEKSINGKNAPEVRLHIWLEAEGGVYFGRGRYELLNHIAALGSLKLAAEKMGISYRAAWGKIKKSEQVIGRDLIHKVNNKEGYKLTEFGIRFINEFRTFYDDVSAYASNSAAGMIKRLTGEK